MLGLITGAVQDRSARGIAAAVSRLVTAGSLPAGSRLPTVRDVARELGVSPTTVSEAWQSLARAGAIRTRGRSGTFVAAPVPLRGDWRYTQLAGLPVAVGRDLSTGVPDHDLLPDLTGALRRIGDGRLTTSYLDEPVLDGLERVLRERWPFEPERLTVVDGALDALDRIVAATIRFGDRVLVENPTFAAVLDLLQTAGASVAGVPMDDQGIEPAALAAALGQQLPATTRTATGGPATTRTATGGPATTRTATGGPATTRTATGGPATTRTATGGPATTRTATGGPATTRTATRGPVALFLQPRAHNPTGVSMTAGRAEALAAVLAGHPDVLVVEDDHAGDIATAPPVSLGRYLPRATVHVAGFSKSHGPDLRLAAIGGPAALVAAVADRRLLGPGWSSRLLQGVLLDLLTDPVAAAQVAAARDAYASRRAALLDALARRGVAAGAADGINLWLPVDDQQIAMVSLAARGIAVAPGAPFCVYPLRGDHVRVTVGLVADGFDDLADALASAAILDSRGGGARARAHPRGWR